MSFTIIGTGSAYPSCVKTNDDLSKLVDTSDEWIKTRSGISRRHICTEETITDLSVKAALSALENAGISAQELDLIICTTVRGDYFTPSLACLVQMHINAKCPAFDVNGACTGFIYALDVALGYFARKKAKKILVISAETMSKMIDWTDRATCVLFGDGAGAVVLSEGDDLLSIKLTADGNDKMLLIPSVEGDCPYSLHKENKKNSYISMQGQEVFKFAVNAICADLKDVIEEANLTEEDIDYVLLHQANIRIIESAKNKLNISKEKYLVNIEEYGNTSSATIPILLDESNKNNLFKKGDILAFSAFGGGLTTGACIIRWNK